MVNYSNFQTIQEIVLFLFIFTMLFLIMYTHQFIQLYLSNQYSIKKKFTKCTNAAPRLKWKEKENGKRKKEEEREPKFSFANNHSKRSPETIIQATISWKLHQKTKEEWEHASNV